MKLYFEEILSLFERPFPLPQIDECSLNLLYPRQQI